MKLTSPKIPDFSADLLLLSWASFEEYLKRN